MRYYIGLPDSWNKNSLHVYFTLVNLKMHKRVFFPRSKPEKFYDTNSFILICPWITICYFFDSNPWILVA